MDSRLFGRIKGFGKVLVRFWVFFLVVVFGFLWLVRDVVVFFLVVGGCVNLVWVVFGDILSNRFVCLYGVIL